MKAATLLLLQLWGSFVHALDTALLAQLLLERRRPTMAMIERAYDGVSDLHLAPPYNSRKTKIMPFVERLVRHGPKLIAALESTFPGATWAFIGRDSELISDLVEAFYLSIGQKDRVVRIGSSKPTVENADPNTILAYLKSKGLDFEDPMRPPFIFIDTVSNGGGRQGRLFVSTVYDAYQRAGKNPSELLRQVNLFGLIVSTTQGSITDFKQKDSFFAAEHIRYMTGQVANFFNDHHLIGFAEPEPLFNESGYEHYTWSWHGPFGPLVQDPGGNVTDSPGEVQEERVRTMVLSSQVYIHREVRHPSFREAVIKEAKELGFAFPLKRQFHASAPEQPEPEIDASMRELLQEAKLHESQIIDSLEERMNLQHKLNSLELTWSTPKKGDGSPNSLTANGQTLLQLWHEDHFDVCRDEVVGFEFFKALRRGRKGLKLRSADLKIIANEIFAGTPISLSLAREFENFANEANAFHDMVENDAWIRYSAAMDTVRKLKRLTGFGDKSCADLLAKS